MNSEKVPDSGDFMTMIINERLRHECITEVAVEAPESGFAEAKLQVAAKGATPEDDGGIFVPCKLGACGVKLSLEGEQPVNTPTNCPRFEASAAIEE